MTNLRVGALEASFDLRNNAPRRFHRIAMERVPEPRTGHAAPGRAELERVRLPQVFYGREVPSCQPRSHPCGHPWQVLKIEREQPARQVPRMQHGQAIRLVEVRGDLGEPTRGRAHRAIDLCIDELGCLPEIRDDGAGVVALDSSNRSRLWYIWRSRLEASFGWRRWKPIFSNPAA